MENVNVEVQPEVTTEATPVQPTVVPVRKVLLKEVAGTVGMDEKKLRRFLREKKFSKPARQWFWDEGSADLLNILANAKSWEAEEDNAKAPTVTPPPVEEPSVETKEEESTSEPAEPEATDDPETPETEPESETPPLDPAE
jgi:hypothetical protein